MSTRKQYTFRKFAFDLIMISLTGGLWLIWMVFRLQRNN